MRRECPARPADCGTGPGTRCRRPPARRRPARPQRPAARAPAARRSRPPPARSSAAGGARPQHVDQLGEAHRIAPDREGDDEAERQDRERNQQAGQEGAGHEFAEVNTLYSPQIRLSSSAKADDPVPILPQVHMQRSYWVYILAGKIGGTLYVGVTNDLVQSGLRTSDGSRRRLYEKIQSSSARVFRAVQRHRSGNPSRKAAEEMESRVEDCAD